MITGNSAGCIPRFLTVPVVTLDCFLESLGRSPAVIKIDGEGGEFAVLAGACRTLAVVRQHFSSRCTIGARQPVSS
jgi:FkbM family methyltransferase